ncbi:MAG: preprotein translocase subunit SecY [Clostridiales bacterium]|nr:preprotein translocase subunit SecY [Clostridiales bacterium]
MLEILRNAWKVEELRKKILYTLFMLLIYRLVGVVPTPGVNVAYIQQAVSNSDLWGILNMLNGGNFASFTLLAMGVSPYITASIVIQLLTIAIPKLEELSKQGEEGRKKLSSITRYATVALGAIQAIGIIVGMGKDAVISPNFFTYLTIALCMAAGTAFAMWVGERITENGIGNGISLLIFVGIVAALPTQFGNMITSYIDNPASLWTAPIIVIAIVGLIVGVICVDLGQRKIPVQYAKRVVGRKMYGGQSTFLPIKVNSVGVLPLIFASSIIQFPLIIANFWPNGKFTLWLNRVFSSTHPVYLITFAGLIIAFTFFYSLISFNPVEISKNIQQNGGFIPGIRPGRPTSDYIKRVSNRLNAFNAVFLAIIAVIPSLFIALTGSASPFTATGILIAVSVSIETAKQIESQMLMRHYKGFLR